MNDRGGELQRTMSFVLRIRGKSKEHQPLPGEHEIWVQFNAPHGYVLLSPGALEAIGVGCADRVEVLVGEGEDEGRIAFRRECEGNGYALSKHRTVGLFPLVRDLKLEIRTAHLKGEVREGLLVVDLRKRKAPGE